VAPENLIRKGFKHLPDETKTLILENINNRNFGTLKFLAEKAGVNYSNLLYWKNSNKIV